MHILYQILGSTLAIVSASGLGPVAPVLSSAGLLSYKTGLPTAVPAADLVSYRHSYPGDFAYESRTLHPVPAPVLVPPALALGHGAYGWGSPEYELGARYGFGAGWDRGGELISKANLGYGGGCLSGPCAGLAYGDWGHGTTFLARRNLGWSAVAPYGLPSFSSPAYVGNYDHLGAFGSYLGDYGAYGKLIKKK